MLLLAMKLCVCLHVCVMEMREGKHEGEGTQMVVPSVVEFSFFISSLYFITFSKFSI